MKLKTIVILNFMCFLGALPLFSQSTMIRGKITDATDGNPVPFARVMLQPQGEQTPVEVRSDLNGCFEINPASERVASLSFFFTGYEDFTLPLTPKMTEDTLHIALIPVSMLLDEVVIQARSVVTRADRKVILPTTEQTRTATDGADLIRKMQLPRIMVDPQSGEITQSGNGQVQLRINGVQVTHMEIASLAAEDILRIEYHDDPGARYGNVAAVIDYITRKRESGGHVSGTVMHGIGRKRASADDRLALKIYRGKSEWSASASYVQRKQDWIRDYNETLTFPTQVLHRVEKGDVTPFNKKLFTGQLNYSWTEKERFFLNVQLRYTLADFPDSYGNRKSTVTTSASEEVFTLSDHLKEKSHSPALDVYAQFHLPYNQLLIFNTVGTYIDTDNRRYYQEKLNGMPVHEFRSDISGDKYSLVMEGIYEKKWPLHTLSAGMNHLQAYTSNTYTGTTPAMVSLRQAETHMYGEYSGRAGKWGWMGNVTGARLYYRQKDNFTEKFALHPSARLSVEPTKGSYVRYRIGLRHQAPSLAAMNDVEQTIDTWQVRRGNPDLKVFRTWDQRLTAGYERGIFGFDILAGYEYQYHPIMESVFYEGGKFIRREENQQSFQNLNAEATFRVKPWREHLTEAITPGVNRFISTGNEYLHTYTLPELRVNLDFVLGNWLANFTTVTPPRYMYGEQLINNKQMHMIMAGYKTGLYTCMIGVTNPFLRSYVSENKDWSALDRVDSEIYMKHTRSVVVRLGFNLTQGKVTKGMQKRLQHVDLEPGVMNR